MSSNANAFDGDPFYSFPYEIRNQILRGLNHRDNILAISQASPAMNTIILTDGGSPLKKYLEVELGLTQLWALTDDALAVVMFPSTAHIALESKKKEAIEDHIKSWRSQDLYHCASDAEKLAAYTFVDEVAIPFTEDFAALTQTIDTTNGQIRVPDWAHESRKVRADASLKMNIWEYEPEERVRLIRGFCRFEILSKVIRARPGRQLFSYPQQRLLFNEYFDAWEMEEVLCVQQYVGEMHTMLLEAHIDDIIYTLADAAKLYRMFPQYMCKSIIRLRRGPFHENGNGIVSSDETENNSVGVGSSFNDLEDPGEDESNWDEDLLNTFGYLGLNSDDDYDDESQFSDSSDEDSDEGEVDYYTKTDDEADPGTLCTKFELADYQKQTIFLKQVATFGLDFLQHFLKSPKQAYTRWIHANGHIMLHGLANPNEAKYFGPLGNPRSRWIQRGDFDPVEMDGATVVAVGPSQQGPNPTNATLSYGRFPGALEQASNTAWKHLDGTNPQLREAFRRCGWVFWSDERLRANVFWNRRRDVFLPEAAPAWLYRHPGASSLPSQMTTTTTAATAAEPADYFLPLSRIDLGMRMAIREAGVALPAGFRSAAEVKLLSFLAENQGRSGKILFAEHPFDVLRGDKIPLDFWQECLGGQVPAAAPGGAVQLFRDIVWG
ncbi:hypothetical protein CH63R_12119 [Colletotrichum higginsianum IMI 349063]|uniref:Uncharacterized protein n=3 Tax=Colletotrichum higginsianum TaxID=80884 RepID=A0A1B7Y073_COLHI|nr:hypothetical protein CH63R_12119 [Colletotrichum higginsianum IMI 349063]OBR05416.1 hypothetical protein CH63R_12119 [Colletotrichum higginsianum IMI 349063]TIC93715.1 hypothetical protein CH35J_009782 [Colletotrichum higginsianum]